MLRNSLSTSAAASALAMLFTIAGSAPPARADFIGHSYDNRAALSLSASGGAHLDWNADPANWYLNAQAYVDHPDAGPGGTFAQQVESFSPAGTGLVSTSAISEGNFAGVDFVSAQRTAAGAELLIGQPGADAPFAGLYASSPPVSQLAFADARVEISNLLRLVPDDPENPVSFADLTVSLDGLVNLFSDNAAFVEYLAYVEILDLAAPAVPVFSHTAYNRLDAPGVSSLSDSLAFTSAPITLATGRDYYLNFIFDVETKVPAPASLALLAFAAPLFLRRPRRGALAAPRHSR